MNRILVIGDSLPLPTDELSYEDTWIYRISHSNLDIDVVDKCVRARSVESLMHGGPKGEAKNLFEWYHPDIVILHLGVSDCAPRLLPRKSKFTKILNNTPFAKYVYSFLRKHHGRRIEYADLSPEEFVENIEGYVKKVMPVHVGIVKISKVCGSALMKSPRFNDAIEIYNKLLDEIAANNSNAMIIEGLDGSDTSMYQSDGIHLTAKGQTIIYGRCYAYIDSIIRTV